MQWQECVQKASLEFLWLKLCLDSKLFLLRIDWRKINVKCFYILWVVARQCSGMGYFAARALERLSVAWLRAGEAERGTGSALVSLSVGMCLHKRGQFPCLTASTSLRVFHNCQTKHRTGEWNCVQLEFRIQQQTLTAVLPTRLSLPSLPVLAQTSHNTPFAFIKTNLMITLANLSTLSLHVCLCLCLCVWISFWVLSL